MDAGDGTSMIDDILAWPRMNLLAACLEQEVTAADLPQLSYIGVMPGGQAAMECDFGWVRLVTAFNYTQFPIPNQRVGCDPGALGFNMEVGIGRCYPIPSDGSAPSAEQAAEGTRLQMADMAAIRRAIICCLGDDVEYLFGQYTPFGPQGGIVGGSWQVGIPTV